MKGYVCQANNTGLKQEGLTVRIDLSILWPTDTICVFTYLLTFAIASGKYKTASASV